MKFILQFYQFGTSLGSISVEKLTLLFELIMLGDGIWGSNRPTAHCDFAVLDVTNRKDYSFICMS